VHQSVIQSTGFRFLVEEETVRGRSAAGRRARETREARDGDSRDARARDPLTRSPSPAPVRLSRAPQVMFDIEKGEKGLQANNVRDPEGKPFDRPGPPREGGGGGGRFGGGGGGGGGYGDRPPRSYGDRPPRSYGDRPPRSFGDRPPRAPREPRGEE